MTDLAAQSPAPARQAQQGASPAASYQQDFPGRADQLSQVRREIAAYLQDCPAAADVVLIADELAANAIIHTQSRGSTFTVRCQLSPCAAQIEVEDPGGPWRPRNPSDWPHGLDIIAALTGPDGWGTQPAAPGRRTVWARLTW
ncbi:MAG TPA: ATP-binding protein [Streptosporangiaceae bacterium]|nr:ATP-binding protein [Streptosporangiaceae bacterium]